MDISPKDAIANILTEIEATEYEKILVEYSQTGVTKDINQSKVISYLILSKQLKQSTEKFINASNKLAAAEEKNSRKMLGLTWALVMVGILQALGAIISLLK